VDDRVWLGGSNRLPNRGCVEGVQHDGLGAERTKPFRFVP
jgi:hypothetical protein